MAIRLKPARVLDLLVVAALLVALVGVAVVLSSEEKLTALVNGAWPRAWAERLGVRYHVEGASLKFLSRGCPFQIDSRGLALEGVNEPWEIRVEGAHACLSQPATIQGVTVGGRGAPSLVRAAETALFPSPLRVEVQRVNVLDSTVSLEKVSAGAIRLRDRALSIESVAVDSARVVVTQEANGSWNLARAAALRDLGGSLGRSGQLLRGRSRDVLSRARTIAFWAIVVLTALAWVSQFFAARHIAAVPRVLVASLVALLPYGLFPLWGSRPFLFLLASIAVAFALFLSGRTFFLNLAYPMLVLALLLVHGFRFELPSQITVPGIAVALETACARCSEVELGRLESPAKAIGKGLRIELDPATAELRALALDRLNFEGVLESQVLSRELQRLKFLPPDFACPDRLVTRVEARVTSGKAALPSVPPVEGNVPQLSVGALVTVDPPHGTVGGEAAIRWRAPPVDLDISALVAPPVVRLTRIESLPASRLQIQGGEGSISAWDGIEARLQLNGIEAPVSAQSARVTMSLPRPCRSTDLRVNLSLTEVAAQAGALEAKTDRLDLDLERDGSSARARAQVGHTRLRGRRAREPKPWLEAELPPAAITFEGETTEGFIPERVRGRVRLAVSGEVLGVTPLDVLGNVWEGRLDLRPQEVTLRQRIVPQAPERVTFRAEATGRLSLREGTPSAELDFRSEHKVDLSGLPSIVELKELGAFDLLSRGDFPKLPPLSDWLARARAMIPPLPRQVTLIMEGSLPVPRGAPLLRIRDSGDHGAQLHEISAVVQRLRLSPRLDVLEAMSNVTLRTLRGEGNLRATSEVSLSGERWTLKTRIPHPDLDPFLKEFAVDGVSARIEGMEATADDRLDLTLAIDPGSRLLFDAPRAAVSTTGGTLLGISPGRPSGALEVPFETEARGIQIELTDEAGLRYTVTSDVRADGRLVLPESGPSSALTARLSTVGSALSRHAGRALDLLEGAPLSLENIRWQVHLLSPKLLSFENEEAEIRLAVREGAISANGFELKPSLDLKTHLALCQEQLVADGLVHSKNLDLPFVLAFTETLPDDEGFTDALLKWAPHSSPLIHEDQIVLGPLFLQQVFLPGPFRLAVGYGEGLQVHFPLSARALFGRLAGAARGEIRWLGDGAELAGRAELNLENVQTSAIGFAAAGLQVPLLEDDMNGKIRVAVDHLRVNRAVLKDPLAFHPLESVSLDVELQSSPTVPGVLQLSSEARVDLMNRFLNEIGEAIRLHVPPGRLCYAELDFSLHAEKGRILAAPRLLELKGLRLPCSATADLETDLRVFWQRPDQPIPGVSLEDLLLFIPRTNR